MIYSTVNFIFFAAFIVLVFAFLPQKFRAYWLMAANILWYVNWGLVWLGIFVAILILNYLALYFLAEIDVSKRERFYFILTSANIVIFLGLKLFPFLPKHAHTPYGTSFFMLMIMGLIIDSWREQKTIEKAELKKIFIMPMFFPLLISGPIERAKDFFPQLNKLEFKLDNLSDGIIIFSIGLLKKIFIVDYFVFKFIQTSFNNFIIEGLLTVFITYLTFSSFCDMGRGIAKIFGIDVSINFRPFYYAKNPNDFWQRWNITLSKWIRDYVTFPMMFKWGRKLSPNFIIIISFIAMGFWHGISWNWFVFGIYNGLIIFLYNRFNAKFSSNIFGYALTVCIWIGGSLFQFKNFNEKLTSPLSFGVSPQMAQVSLVYLLVVLSILFVFEYFQEKYQNSDFFLKWPVKLKFLISILFVLAFLYSLNSNQFQRPIEMRPMYFTI